jgi:hypothetical protein
MVNVNKYINVHGLLLKKQFYATFNHDIPIWRTGSYWNLLITRSPLWIIPSLQNQLFWVTAENSVFIHSCRYQTSKIIYNVVKTALS